MFSEETNELLNEALCEICQGIDDCKSRKDKRILQSIYKKLKQLEESINGNK